MTTDLSTALIVAPGTDLTTFFHNSDAIDPLLSAIEAEVRSHVPDITTIKGREAIKSLAFKVARSKTALDDAGKLLNEEARKQINIVDAARRKIRERLDALRDEARQPLTDWEDAERARIERLNDRLAALDAGRADIYSPSAQIAGVLAEIEATEIGEDWDELRGQAAIAKDTALVVLRRSLAVALKREADEAELERLRQAEIERIEDKRRRLEVAEAAAKLAERAQRAQSHIEAAQQGTIGGHPQSYDVLIYELQHKIPPFIDELGVYAEDLHNLRIAALEKLVAARDAEREAAMIRAEADRQAAAAEAAMQAEKQAEEARVAAIEAQKMAVAAAAKRERDRIEMERRAEDDARRKREENAKIRNRVKKSIADAIDALTPPLNAVAIAEAIMRGDIPNVTVRF